MLDYTLFIIPNGVRLAHKTLEKLSIPSRARSYIYNSTSPFATLATNRTPQRVSMEIQKSKLSSSDVVVSEEDSCSVV